MNTMRNWAGALGFLWAAATGIGCATVPNSSAPGEAQPAASVVQEALPCPPPDWYTNPPPHPRFLIAAATAVSQDMQLAYDKAVLQARAEIGRQLETWAYGVQDLAVAEITGEELGPFRSQYTAASRLVVRQSIEGSGIVDRTPVCRGPGGFRA